ncbi:hypothetical protein JKP75_14225 [Blastococcus sp. TML/M2B]|nr:MULTISPECIES: hypothetical protein [unclassified Blastococcus]MBN1093607.1 hypothetical protein [Blastococcus sp. TML/M2B]MBN1096273.1 hypothetical protein [Blastococcus sp. TML/C7B]
MQGWLFGRPVDAGSLQEVLAGFDAEAVLADRGVDLDTNAQPVGRAG